MKNPLLILCFLCSFLLSKAQELSEKIEDYKPCLECFQESDNWKTTKDSLVSSSKKKLGRHNPPNINGSNNNSNNNSNNPNSFLSKAKSGLGTQATLIIGLGVSLVTAVIITKISTSSNGISIP